MSIWAIVPVKPLNRAKSRLAPVLSPDMRYHFATMLLQQVLTVIRNTPEITGTLVISRDTKALALAREIGAKTIQESNPSELNLALTRATGVLQMWRAQACMIIPADLPFLNRYDLSQMIKMGNYGTTAVIATDEARNGTNVMLLRPPGLIEYAYGEGSFHRHVARAEAQNATVHIYQSPHLQLDIDTPDDLVAYNDMLEEGQYEYLLPLSPDSNLAS